MSIENKKRLVKEQVKSSHGCSGPCAKCTLTHKLIDKMEESRVPIGYWFSKMSHFKGSEKLKELIDSYIRDIKSNYLAGKSICLVGGQGIGKTYSACCIMKYALRNNLSGYYISAVDMMNEIIVNKENIRNTLKEVDFLIIDELDSRFFTSNAQKELFGSIFENIFRSRCQNTFPTIICSNEPESILNVFSGQAVQSINSLCKQYLKTHYIASLDFRKTMENENNTR